MIEFDNYSWLNLAKLFVNDTDTLVNTPKHYVIHLEEIEKMLKRLNQLDLIHNDKKRNLLSCLKMKYLNYYRIKKKLDDETTKVLKLTFEKYKKSIVVKITTILMI